MHWIVIAVVSGAAGILMLGANEPPMPPPVAGADYVPLSNALYWLGGCSVTCSMIAGFTLITLARLKRRDRS